MNIKVLAVISGAFLVLSAIMGIYTMFTLPQADAFIESELTIPSPYIGPDPIPVPSISGDWIFSPDVSVLVSIGSVYVDYGSSIRVQIQNNGSRDIFLQDISFQWTDSGITSILPVDDYIRANESYIIKALSIRGPSTSGHHTYQLSMRVLVERNNEWYSVSSHGNEWVEFAEHTIQVSDLSEVHDYDLEFNYRTYYRRVNELIDFDSDAVAIATENATAGMGTGFNIGKVAAIYDYLDENCVYTEDPGGDKWYSPDEFLSSLAGDCEDYAMLISAMVNEIGGFSRVYLTIDHAYATVFVGNTFEDFENASADIEAYYGTELKIHAMVDETGYWLIADPLGNFHLGGLAVGQSPTELYNGTWNTTFEESDLLHAIDVTGFDINVPIWFEPNFWMGMMLVFGFITILGLMTGGPKKGPAKIMCHICAQEVGKDLYLCPGCKTPFHRHCAFENAYCMTCQAPILFPPPPDK